MDIVHPVLILGGIGLSFGLIIAIAAVKLHVFKDPRVEKIQNALPDYNCGACGYPGCSAFARAVAEGNAKPSACVPGGPKTAHEIADALGVTASISEPMMAVVHCKGGINEVRDTACYDGIEDCHAALLAGNGFKECTYGCLGLGTCVRVCPFSAITINKNKVAVVDPEKCTGCGKCIKACPKSLFSLIPKAHKIFLACSNHETGPVVENHCAVGCTACSVCVNTTTSGAIEMIDSLPVLDYSMDENFITASHKCPQKCFVDLVRARPKVNIDTKCDGCGECVPACPIDEAIIGEKGKRHRIDKDKCIGCGICLKTCHAHAIGLWGGLGYEQGIKSKRQRH